ncbi:hypothetical protein NP493_2g09049 [Ridgeia piscesae]|uniref:Glucosidase 2 subunit beta n=1 Tax=Ridgeia piscesae TaxID=27915 RepID=A0AAD9ULX4_RIDPI|nr:hypothetical protein NP493_2g09049 [Ridgeia piscesae]
MEIFVFCWFTSLFHNNMAIKKAFTFVICSILIFGVTGRIERPRGVAISKASFYLPDRPFVCFDGSATISFEKVNDDYCDCTDASDEPGTSACPNGSFHCTNAGHKPQYIPSSRVNDGICDCCDGTDEYDSDAQCTNYCKELGKKAREEAERQRQLLEEGRKVYLDYAVRGKESVKEKQERLEQLRAEKDEAERRKNELEGVKKEAEVPETEAKEQHKKAWEEEKARLQSNQENERSDNAFKILDTNNDGVVSVEEMQEHSEFDIDTDGTVSVEEAKEYLEDSEQVDYETFHGKVWPNIKEIYTKEKEKQEAQEEELAKGDTEQPPEPTVAPDTTTPPPEEPVTTPTPTAQPPEVDPLLEPEEDLHHNYDDDEEDRYNEDEDDDDDDEEEKEEDKKAEVEPPSSASDTDDKMPEYDENTKGLIELADKAREDFNEADRKFRDIESEISKLESLLDIDFGGETEFYPLYGECFEMTDREYTYKLCPFDKATQRSKNGGSETSLGKWSHWDGPDGNKYSVMKFEKGQNCWNGPDRSVKVNVNCGKENQLLTATEPNKCEYEFQFVTPTACSQVPSPADESHDEL